jgi:hypothetical protein
MEDILMTLDIPQVWILLKRFKHRCAAKGWEISESEDWVRKNGQYHNFLWTTSIHPSTFKRIAATRRCAINEGVSYRVVDVSYTAWLLSQAPTEALKQMVIDDPELLRRNAIYDLSWLHADNPVCLRLNKTNSAVFREFEKFLEEEWGVQIKSSRGVLVEEV